MMSKQTWELLEASKDTRITGFQAQVVQLRESHLRRGYALGIGQGIQHQRNDQRHGNSQRPSAFKPKEASRPHDHHAAKTGPHTRNWAHPISGLKEIKEASSQARTGSRGGRQHRQPQQAQKRSESVSAKDRSRHDQSEPHRRNPKFYGSQPDLLDIFRKSNGGDQTQSHQRPPGRQHFSRGMERDTVQTSHENTSQHQYKGARTKNKCGTTHLRHNFKPSKESRETDAQKQGTLDGQELTQLAAMYPVDIVMKLTSPGSGVKEFLNQANIEKDLIASFLKILGMTFNCKSNRRSLHYLLELIKNSKFLKNVLPPFIINAQSEVSQEAHLESATHLGYILNLLCQLITVYPASVFSDVCLLTTMVQSTSNYLQSVGFPISEEMDKNLSNLHQMITYLQEKKREGSLLSDTYTYFVAPKKNDFRHISIYPTYEDIHLINKPFVRPNIINEKYPDTATYLDIHFRLLREDFVRPLREGISKLLNCSQKDLRRQPIDDIRIYFNSHVLDPLCTYSGVFYRVQFDNEMLKHVRWESSKRLLYGSFLCLSKDNFETMLFATVAHRNLAELTKGIITLSFIESSRLDLVDVKSTDSFLMVETTAYFEAYRHVLEGFKEIADNEIPFQKYIVQCQTCVAEPKYLRQSYQSYNMEPLLEGKLSKPPKMFSNVNYRNRFLQSSMSFSHGSNFNVLDYGAWPSKERLKCDKSQILALQAALTKELAIIQGPPGTGKTYLGLKAVSVLLANMNLWQSDSRSPILVVCYTNHALDQFLEGIHTFMKTGLVRVGGRSSSTILAKFSMAELRKQNNFRKNLPSYLKSMYSDLIGERKELQKKIEMLIVALEASRKGVLQLPSLSKYIQTKHLQDLKVGSVYNPSDQFDILEWLQLTTVPECYIRSNTTVEQAKEDDAETIASSATEGDVGNLSDFIEEEDGDDELIQVTEEAALMQAERIMDDDNLPKQLQKAHARLAKLEKQFLAFNPKETAPPKSEAEDKDDGKWEVTTKERKRIQNMVKQQLQNTDVMTELEARKIDNVWNLNLPDRWRLYRWWLSMYQAETKRGILDYEESYRRIVDRLAELRNQEEITLLRMSKVVGMTTTGAAKYRNLVQDIRPRIVIVEEAAEVLEAHIITTLTSDCQHLILIGDHQQLRPSATVYELARRFNLEVSLFERLIMMDVPFVRLDYQHRMRPEIAKLITPHIYEKLENTESVKLYENIKGISTNLYFIDHQEPEDQFKEGKSYQNPHEAHFVTALCKYFIQQEYKPSQITILTTYSGQLFCLKNMMPKVIFDGVHVCVVDKYQGEENDIVILSLVRSNKQGVVGFLRIQNRVCVALSRAKKAFYCIGNMSLLAKQVPLWAAIVGSLRETGNIGPSLRLACQNHPQTDTLVSSAGDFAKVPEGGCLMPCNFPLQCRHACTLCCHPYDPQHKEYRCPLPCPKACTVGHPCPKLCWQPCGDCKVKVSKVIPACGHEQQVACSMPPERFSCQEPCRKTLDCGHKCLRPCGEECTWKCPSRIQLTQPCGHQRWAQCYQRQEAETWPCQATCGAPLACGHPCTGSCLACGSGRLHAPCKAPCARVLPCSHPCSFSCCGPLCPPCPRPCRNRCPHGKCPRACGKPCLPCQEPCAWSCPHARCTRLCHEPCDRLPCDQPCSQVLDCGHPCIGLCGEPCPNKCRTCHEEEVTEIFFGGEDQPDTRFLQLQECRHIFAVKEFDKWMQQADGNGSPEPKLPLCPKCSTPIQNSLRYGAVIKSGLAEIERIKVKAFGDEEELRDHKTCLLQFLEENKELTKYFLMEVFDLQLQLEESSTSLHKLTTLGHKITLLSKIVDLKSGENKLQVYQRVTIQQESERLVKWITENRDNFTSQELSDIKREISRLKYLNELYLIQTTMRGQIVESETTELQQMLEGKKKYNETWVQENIDILKKKCPVRKINLIF
ncbi:NFX1-type zinc finger-containing protein 1-like [Hypanus sabinus]|uniref:NFX1-type zinc finger-containing protein 1-like n=1 Tax=Hypanus sabinus TaxID=79690 RepID=UPI0028C48F8D|nr:NFX1-type zinc finger-containing protein 1-like [Hypanus sabinus]XP_059801345.1 NFX1-type zinc finger-containing protein 1-like [Hypanus sabinus]